MLNATTATHAHRLNEHKLIAGRKMNVLLYMDHIEFIGSTKEANLFNYCNDRNKKILKDVFIFNKSFTNML